MVTFHLSCCSLVSVYDGHFLLEPNGGNKSVPVLVQPSLHLLSQEVEAVATRP